MSTNQNGGDVHFTPPQWFGSRGNVNQASFTVPPPMAEPYNPPRRSLDDIRQRNAYQQQQPIVPPQDKLDEINNRHNAQFGYQPGHHAPPSSFVIGLSPPGSRAEADYKPVLTW